MTTAHFPGRLGLVQRVLPSYRVAFFDALAGACGEGMSLFAGQPQPREAIAVTRQLRVARYAPAQNLHLFSGSLYLCYQRGLLDWLADWNPDALIVEANPRYLATPAALRWMKERGRPVIGWGLGAPALSEPLAAFRYRRRTRFLSQFDALISYSQRGADEYAALGFPAKNIFIAPNAVAPRPTRKPGSRPLTVDRPTILFVGRLQARKRVDLLMQACAQMPEPKPRLVIVGDGPAWNGLKTFAAQACPSAEFIGAKHGAELYPYFTAADLFVLPGTGGLAVQEAMTYSLPVIVAQGDGTQDDLVRPGNGWQIPPDNLPALTSALQEALADIPRLRRMGAESYRIVDEEINIEKMVDRFMAALAGVHG